MSPSLSILGTPEENNAIVWCTISEAEQRKCLDFARAVNKTYSVRDHLTCYQAADKDRCMSLIDVEKADLITLDPGEIYIAGRYNSLVPIMAERYGPGNFFNIIVQI